MCSMLIAALTACGGDDTPDPLQKYHEQTVRWTECDPNILGGKSQFIDDLQPSNRLRCALVRAPLDWSNAERGDIAVSVMRLAAGTQAERRGALVFNPGGPGADGLGATFKLFEAFAGSDPADPQGARQLRLLNEYDMVGFSPRGTGASTRLQCATNELEHFVDFSAAGWEASDNLANVHYNGSKTAEACLKNPITPYINTDATARDMELLRVLLGDDKLNYVGYSYGTWLGSWYASLFPERVGRMVLDSALDFGTTLEKSLLHSQPPARQRLFDDFLVPYAVRHADYFHLGTSDADVRAVMPGMHPRVQAVLAEKLSALGYSRTQANTYLGTISIAQGLDAALRSVADQADWAAVEKALSRHQFDPRIAERDAALRQAAGQLYGDYAQTWLNPQMQSFNLQGGAATGTAVRCNDTPSITDLTVWTTAVSELAGQAPMYFGGLLQFNACAFWPGPSVTKPDAKAMKMLDVLFVQSQFDSATNTDGASKFFAQLPQAHRVYVSGDFQHGVYPYEDACVDPLVTGYLLGDSLVEREAVCTAKPLQQDETKLNASQKAASATEISDQAIPAFRDSRKASDLIDQFKRALAPAG